MLTGTVADDLGTTLDRFRIQVRRGSEPTIYRSGLDLNKTFSNANGTFDLEGLPPGHWIVQASARGHAASNPGVPVGSPCSGSEAATAAASSVNLTIARSSRKRSSESLALRVDGSGAIVGSACETWAPSVSNSNADAAKRRAPESEKSR